MRLAVYVDRMLEALHDSEVRSTPRDSLFSAFVALAGRQIRAPYYARHPAREVLNHLAEIWDFAQVRTTHEPVVMVHKERLSCAVFTMMADQPFIVDTVRLCLRQAGATYVGGANLVLSIGRDEEGRIVRVGKATDPSESLMRIDADGIDEDVQDGLKASIRGALRMSQAIVADFHAMTDLVDASAYRFTRLADRTPHQADILRETADFLRWLLSDNFVFMSVVSDDKTLGLANPALSDIWDSDAHLQWPEAGDFPVQVRKGRQDCRVHRAGRIDEIRVLVPRGLNKPSVPLRIRGLFTYRAVTQPSRHVPLLRKVLANILRDQDSRAGSYRYKGIANVFDSLPTEFLFTASPQQITDTVDRVLEAEQEQQIRVHLVQDSIVETSFVLAAMPRGQWSERLRQEVEALLRDVTGATAADHGVFVGRFDTMLAHWYLTGSKRIDEEGADELVEEITRLATPWEVRLYQELELRYEEDIADGLISRYATAFDEMFRSHATPARAALDIGILEELSAGDVRAAIFRDERDRLSLRIYQDTDVLLSDLLPVLDNLGLVVNDQYQDRVTPRGRPPITIDTFRLQDTEELRDTIIEEHGQILVDAVGAIFRKQVTDDELNRVVLRAGVPWAAVDLLRAYIGYSRQIGLRYTQSRTQELLLAQPELVRQWWELFRIRFDPDHPGSRDRAFSGADDAFMDGVRLIQNHDQDVLFRNLHNLLCATLRTNFFRTDRAFHYISIKVDHGQIRHMPVPRMMYEIYVHHREMEGVHLRGGRIARGGIRWSDREDYRREILDLVATQMVKNVLIVPEGAKGGFYIKHVLKDHSKRRVQADRLYKVLIRGLLDLTDNIKDGEIVHPPRVVRHDEDDPYLVVAADKGTAHLSDTANALSRDYGFWLDDAFASGGSNGYDHKKVGITARGGWATVDRHFREMGLDPVTDTFTCVGVGDPSGDVFGNGVVQYKKMKLLAAFNHRHVFIDPDPDPEKTWVERKRLFDEVKGWDAYDQSLLSEGGGIFSRQAKSIQLSPQIQKMLGVLTDDLPVDTVLRLLLRLNVDLLWNGGIGTYVKASDESHSDAGDPTNDELRVNATELRCKVVGEGGNLGFTQRGRIEYALKGGRINTDAIDNSGGVDMSDHEVNLKILLSPLVRDEKLKWDDRNELLESLTDVVADQVLENSDRHASQLSLDQIRSARDPMRFSRVIDWVCRHGDVSRRALRLPTDDDLGRRSDKGQGLTRPELAVLSAHVKMHIFKELKEADPQVIPSFHGKVRGYFPQAIQDDYDPQIAGHMLYPSIGMTVVTGEVIGAAGALFFPLAMELTGQPAVRVAAAWYAASDFLGTKEIFDQLATSKASLDARYLAWVAVQDAVMSLVTLWLAPGEPALLSEDPAVFKEIFSRLARMRGTMLEARLLDRANLHTQRKINRQLAQRIAVLGEVVTAREVARTHREGERVSHSVIRYLAVGEASQMLPAIRAIDARTAAGGWDPIAIGILRTRFVMLMRELVMKVSVGSEVRLGVDRVATRLSRGPLKELRNEVQHIVGDRPEVANLLVAEERIRGWLAREIEGDLDV